MLKHTTLRNSLAVFCSMLFVGYTIAFHIHPYRSFFNDLAIFVGLFAMVLYCGTTGDLTIRVPRIVLLPLVFIVIIVLQLLNNMIWYPVDMTFPILYFVCLALAFICGATIAMQEQGLSTLCTVFAYTFLAAGLVSVSIQHIQLFDFELSPWIAPLDWDMPIRPFANFAQPNSLALSLCFALASTWYLFLSDKVRGVVAIACAVLLLWGLALTQSRIGWMIVPLFAFACWNQRSPTIRSTRLILSVGLLSYIVFVLLSPSFLEFSGGIADSIETRAGQTGVRLVLWLQALAMSMAHPWFGAGWFQFGPQQVLTATAFKPTEYSDYAHNLIFNLLAEIGWPLTMLFVAATCYWIWRCLIQQRGNVHVRFVSLIVIAAGVHSMVEFPLWYAFFLIPFGILLGAVNTESIGWTQYPLPRFWPVAIGIVGLLSMGFISYDYQRMSRGFDAIAKIQAGDNRYLPNIQKPAFTLFPQYYDYFHIVEIPITQNIKPIDVAFLERISVRFGFAPILSRVAIVYANQRRVALAVHLLDTVQRIDGAGYGDVYAQWSVYAKENPAQYGAVYKKMPVPANQ